jgi:nucleoside-diphosphate-sugar epimerase
MENSGHNVIGVDSRQGDLRMPDVAHRLLVDCQPDVVIHLAALTGRLFGDDDPAVTVTTNALGTLNVAKACGHRNVRLIYISTSEAHGDHGDAFVKGDTADVLPHNIYGLSKRWGEEAARLYAPDGLQIIRLSMPYGPGLPAGRGRAALITFLWNALHNQPLTVHRNASRCWCWVGDMMRGLRMIVDDAGVGMWTIGRDDNETPMMVVAKEACRIAGRSEDLIVEVPAPANQTLVKRLPIERVRGIGWTPTVNLSTGMTLTMEAVKMYDDTGMPPQNGRPL